MRTALVVTFLSILFYVGISFAGDFPESGKLSLGGAAETHSFEVVVMPPTENAVTLKVKVFPEQVAKEKLSPKWAVCASYSYWDGNQWVLVSKENYRLETKATGGIAEAKMTFDIQGDFRYWLRVWVEDTNSKAFGWIAQNDPHYRVGEKGKVSYEVLVNTKTGKYQVVNPSYDVRP